MFNWLNRARPQFVAISVPIVAFGLCLFFLVGGLPFLRADEPIKKDIVPETLTFGSAALLNHCWTADDLKSTLQEDKSGVSMGSLSSNETQPLSHSSLPLRPEGLRRSIRSVQPAGGRKLVALTFDLCESRRGTSGYDSGIVNYLRKEKVRATFFAGGKWMRSHPERAMQLIADPLFEVGNHSDTHLNLHLQSKEEIDRQILAVQNEYIRAVEHLKKRTCAKDIPDSEWKKLPSSPGLFRFPFGRCDPIALERAAFLGLASIQWSIVTADAAPAQSSQAIARIILTRVRPGSIIIAHANRRGRRTAKALTTVIPELKKRGYDFVTVTELLRSGSIESTDDCYEVFPGDNKRYDASRYNR